ncbi:MAG: efflux RND transporter periplasmic adaptor subunit [Verrucomicrobia bacterium]|nr:efflux RND transporter periplasmic adaptor subunit [Verrucomicrobiota bacterium]
MAKSKSKGRKLLVFTILVLVLGGLGTAAMLRKREVVLTVQTDKVTRRNLTELVPANGRIQPVFYVKISPEVSAEIIELPVREGQFVKRGDLLVKLKPDVYQAQRNSSEASYKASLSSRTTATATLARAEAEFRRQEALFKNSLVSESIYVDARTTYEIAKAQLESATHQVAMARAALDRAEEDLSKTVIHSPLDGVIIRLNSQLGERVVGTAMMAGTEIMTIADLNEMEARVDIGEIDVVLMQTGQTARLEVDAFKDRKFTGTVTEIANSSKGLTLGSGAGWAAVPRTPPSSRSRSASRRRKPSGPACPSPPRSKPATAPTSSPSPSPASPPASRSRTRPRENRELPPTAPTRSPPPTAPPCPNRPPLRPPARSPPARLPRPPRRTPPTPRAAQTPPAGSAPRSPGTRPNRSRWSSSKTATWPARSRSSAASATTTTPRSSRG